MLTNRNLMTCLAGLTDKIVIPPGSEGRRGKNTQASHQDFKNFKHTPHSSRSLTLEEPCRVDGADAENNGVVVVCGWGGRREGEVTHREVKEGCYSEDKNEISV